MLLKYNATATAIRDLFGHAPDAENGDVLEFMPQ